MLATSNLLFQPRIFQKISNLLCTVQNPYFRRIPVNGQNHSFRLPILKKQKSQIRLFQDFSVHSVLNP